MTLVLISLTILTLYILGMSFYMKRIPKSVSETYYNGAGGWFTLVFDISGLLACWGLLDLSEGSSLQFLSFLIGAGLIFVGNSPKFRGNLEGKVHTIGAIVLLLSSQVWIYFHSNPRILVLWLAMAYLATTKQKTFWLEAMCLLTLGLSLIFLN